MQTECRFCCGSSVDMSADLAKEYVDLIVTSPPYPMIKMWDEMFIKQNPRIGEYLSNSSGDVAFELMHMLLDDVWRECDRVLRPGGIICINIGDAVRSINGHFKMYSNHARVLSFFKHLSYSILPDIIWHKPTNAPNKFMGSGMLPVGGYVTYEHEYILIMRKGSRRLFGTKGEKANRMASAYFWEERNVWFSDIWTDIKGVPQKIKTAKSRQRSASFPFELAYRLISMFSVKQDLVVDPFAGAGTTQMAAIVAGRNAVGYELDEGMVITAGINGVKTIDWANQFIADRLLRHIIFTCEDDGRQPFKYVNKHYGFPVVTAQEMDLLINELDAVEPVGVGVLSVRHKEGFGHG